LVTSISPLGADVAASGKTLINPSILVFWLAFLSGDEEAHEDIPILSRATSIMKFSKEDDDQVKNGSMEMEKGTR